MPIVNRQVKFLTTQYIGTSKSVYTIQRGYPKLSTNLTGAGTMLIWFLTKSLWQQADVNFKTYF